LDIDPKTQIVQGRTVCVVSCQRSPEPVFLGGDFFVRSGPGSIKLPIDRAREYIRAHFHQHPEAFLELQPPCDCRMMAWR
jgi:hypothetical protein